MDAEAHVDAAAIDKLLTPYDRTDAPGFAVGVALRGRPLYRRGVGLASVEAPIALSPTIRMRIGSTAKHFCCLAVMLLSEEGRLSIDDSPRLYLPELPEWAEPITLRQLMSHTSGMRDTLEMLLCSGGAGEPAPSDIQLKLLCRLDSVDFAPGATWSYNNAAFELLAAIVERVSDGPLADFLRERIFVPTGMQDTMLRILDTDLVPNSATLHVPTPGGGWRRGVFGVPIHGMGGIVSTVDDMLRWLRHMSRPLVGSVASWDTMRTPHATHGYGLGLFMDTHRGLRTVHHAGGVIGGSCQMLKLLDHELDLVVMSNGLGSMSLRDLVDDIIDCCIPGLPPPMAAAPGPADTGMFHSSTTGRLLGLAEKDGKQALVIGGMTLPARLEQDGSFSVGLLPTDMRVTAVREAGRVVALHLVEYGLQDRLEPVEPSDDAPDAETEGRFEHAPAGMTAVVTKTSDGSLELLLGGPAGSNGHREHYLLDAVGHGIWQTRRSAAPHEPGPVLEFDGDGFRLSTGRLSRLRFTRAA